VSQVEFFRGGPRLLLKSKAYQMAAFYIVPLIIFAIWFLLRYGSGGDDISAIESFHTVDGGHDNANDDDDDVCRSEEEQHEQEVARKSKL